MRLDEVDRVDGDKGDKYGPGGGLSLRRLTRLMEKNRGTEVLVSFIGLPDPDHAVIDLYGQEVSLFKLGRMPAQMLIDRSGVLRLVHYGHSMADIPDNGEVFALLDSWTTPMTQGERA